MIPPSGACRGNDDGRDVEILLEPVGAIEPGPELDVHLGACAARIRRGFEPPAESQTCSAACATETEGVADGRMALLVCVVIA